MTETGRAQQIARRSVLGLVAAAGGSLALPKEQAFAVQERAAGRGPSAGEASSARRPVWSEPGKAWLRGVRLHHTTVLQSFAFDESNRHIYALQVISAGVRLPGEKRTYTHDERVLRGDLCLNRLSIKGKQLDHMYLKGFGHGTTVAVESLTTGQPQLWTEWDARPSSGYGRGVCRFRYAPGRVYTSDSAALTSFRPQPGSTNNNAALDMDRRRLLLRYRLAGAPRYALYDLHRFAAGNFRPLADFAQPGAALGLPFQGMALHDAYAYQLLGSGYGAGNPAGRGGNVRLFRIGLRAGDKVSEELDRTDLGLDVREPEGLAVMRGDRARLFMGLSHGPARGRRFSLYEKSLP